MAKRSSCLPEASRSNKASLKMKKILDVNFIKSDEKLKKYLSNKSNILVAIESLQKEVFKGDKAFEGSLKKMHEYADQLIFLRKTSAIYRQAKSVGFFEDKKGTKDFRYASKFYRENLHSLDPKLQETMRELKKDAENGLLYHDKNVKIFTENVENLSKSFTEQELKILRKNLPVTESMKKKVIEFIFLISESLHQQHCVTFDKKTPKNSFILRYSIALFFLTLNYVKLGKDKNENIRKDRIRNDIIDLEYATFATFFDGLLSDDEQMNTIYKSTKKWLLQ